MRRPGAGVIVLVSVTENAARAKKVLRAISCFVVWIVGAFGGRRHLIRTSAKCPIVLQKSAVRGVWPPFVLLSLSSVVVGPEWSPVLPRPPRPGGRMVTGGRCIAIRLGSVR